MKRYYLLIFILFITLDISSRDVRPSLLVLDSIINQEQLYVNKKQKEIATYRSLLKISKGYQCFQIYTELYHQYASYRLDSALYYAQSSVDIAKRYHNNADLEVALLNMTEVKKKLGRFQEALDILGQINPHSPTLDLHYYYHLYHSINYLCYLDALTENEKREYKQKALYYLQFLLKDAETDKSGYACNKSEEYCLKGEPRKALGVLLNYIRKHPKESASNSFLSYSLAEAYRYLKMPEEEEYYLILTSISDLRDTKKEYMALQQLALLLYNKGEVTKAYNYITYSMHDIVFSRARCRMSYISEVLPIISATYEYKMKHEAKLRTVSITIISILLIFFVIVYLKLRKRNKELTRMQKSLDNRNDELSELNERLSELNMKLSESNRIKEEYIAQLFYLCSSYIDKQKTSRISISRKLIAGKINEVRDELNDTSVEAKELKAFFHYFDELFLKLFPNFITSFNKLLIPGKEILPKDNEILSPELRIYALVRLGISDSSKIAELLHYSVQTVYNYRQRVRNKLSLSKDEFLTDLLRLN
jgi:hypothetical protein